MGKVDYRRELKHLYKASSRRVETVVVAKMNFLMIDGEGDPNTSKEFKDALEALYPLSYALKFMAKKGEMATDYGVMPLEGLWWADDMSSFSVADKNGWKWTLMIMQPELITQAMVQEASERLAAKKNPASLPLLRFESFAEGRAAQIMHVGPFAEEGPTVEKIHAFIEESGSSRTGKHHEIYLSDTRRAAPEKWKTIIRQPMS